MKSLVLEQEYNWTTRFTLTKDEKGSPVLKIMQYQKPIKKDGIYRELHIFGKGAISRLKDFLIKGKDA